MTSMTKLVLQSPLGEELSEDEAGVMVGLLKLRQLAEGDFLIKEGTTDNSLHVLMAGKLEVVKHTGADEMAYIAVLREGDLAGELSFIDGHEHTVSLRALEDCEVLSLDREAFEGIVGNHPNLTYKVMRAIARSTHRMVHRMNSQFIELNNYIFKQHGRY